MSKKVADIFSYVKTNTMIVDDMIAGVSASKLSGTVTDSQIADMDASKLSGTLPAIDGSALTGVPGITNLVEDTSPQLGGHLDFNGHKFTNHILPSAHDTFDIGSAEFKIRDMYVADNTIYMGDSATIKAEGTAIVVQDLKTGDLHLDNTKRDGNSVDGTKGSWTFQEGAEDMYLLNNVTGKKYKINLTEI